MNNATIAATISQKPQLRYTQDDQTPVADFVVQVQGRALLINLKVTAWNELAQSVVGLDVGTVVLLEGSLRMEKVQENGVNRTYPRFTARDVLHLPQLPVSVRPQTEGVLQTSLNSVHLVGRLGDNPDTRFFESGAVVSNFSLAVNRKKKDSQPDWFALTVWGKIAEIAQDYLQKGSEVAIEGTFDFETWKDKATGEDRFKPVIRVNNLKFVGSKRQESGAPVAQPAIQHVPQSVAPVAQPVTQHQSPVPVGAVSGADVPF